MRLFFVLGGSLIVIGYFMRCVSCWLVDSIREKAAVIRKPRSPYSYGNFPAETWFFCLAVAGFAAAFVERCFELTWGWVF